MKERKNIYIYKAKNSFYIPPFALPSPPFFLLDILFWTRLGLNTSATSVGQRVCDNFVYFITSHHFFPPPHQNSVLDKSRRPIPNHGLIPFIYNFPLYHASIPKINARRIVRYKAATTTVKGCPIKRISSSPKSPS